MVCSRSSDAPQQYMYNELACPANYSIFARDVGTGMDFPARTVCWLMAIVAWPMASMTDLQPAQTASGQADEGFGQTPKKRDKPGKNIMHHSRPRCA